MRGPHANPYADSEGVGRVGETPFRRARQEWDSRIGEAVVQARNWRSAFAVVSAALVLAVAGQIYVATLPRRVPWVIEVDRDGPAIVRGEVGEAATKFTPTDPQVRYYVRLFVTSWRRNSSDVGVVKTDEATAYSLVTPDAHHELKKEFDKLGDPLKRAKSGVTKVVEPAAIKITDSTWQVDWTELRWEPQQTDPTESRWRGLFRVQLRPGQSVDPNNPLGMYVDEFHWDKVR